MVALCREILMGGGGWNPPRMMINKRFIPSRGLGMALFGKGTWWLAQGSLSLSKLHQRNSVWALRFNSRRWLTDWQVYCSSWSAARQHFLKSCMMIGILFSPCHEPVWLEGEGLHTYATGLRFGRGTVLDGKLCIPTEVYRFIDQAAQILISKYITSFENFVQIFD